MKSEPTSFPKQNVKILLLENLSPAALKELELHGYKNIDYRSKALGEAELCEAIKGVHILGIRSKTQITKKVLKHADKLLAIGCFCIGTNQVDLAAARKRGIAVFNAPYSNTRSVAELVMGLFVMLMRRIPDKNRAAHNGIWDKDASGSFELRGKTLGIVGYGNIGSQVSILAEAFGMKILYYDVITRMPIGNAKQVFNLDQLLAESDIITLHVPSLPETRNMIDRDAFERTKRGALLINYSRGDVVDLEALNTALDENVITGAAIDVFPVEPSRKGDTFDSILRNKPNVILTPHIGGSTQEAQTNIGLDAVSKLINYVELGTSSGSLSIPEVSLSPRKDTHRILHIHQNIPGVLGEINRDLSKQGINVLGQYLRTNQDLGYVILDIDRDISSKALEILKKVNGTIRTRIVY